MSYILLFPILYFDVLCLVSYCPVSRCSIVTCLLQLMFCLVKIPAFSLAVLRLVSYCPKYCLMLSHVLSHAVPSIVSCCPTSCLMLSGPHPSQQCIPHCLDLFRAIRPLPLPPSLVSTFLQNIIVPCHPHSFSALVSLVIHSIIVLLLHNVFVHTPLSRHSIRLL